MSNVLVLTGIIVTLFFILFFAGMEAAFLSVSRLNIELKKKQGSGAGLLLSKFAKSPEWFGGTNIFCSALCLTFYGLFFNEYVTAIFWAASSLKNELLQLFINTILATFIVVFIGRFLARVIFNRNEKLFYGLLLFFNFFYNLFHRIIKFFITFSNNILKYLFNVKIRDENHPFDRMQLDHVFQQVRDAEGDNIVQDLNAGLLERALALPNIKIRECRTPRMEISGVSVDASIDELQLKFTKSTESKLVVYEGSIDNILGYVDEKSLFDEPNSIREILLPTFTVPESMNIVDLLTRFSKEKKSLAWVVDEFGGTAGIITTKDILRELFGEAQNEPDKDELTEQKISDTEYVFSGRLELEYLNEEYDFDFPQGTSDTLSGYIIRNNKAIPDEKKRVIIDDYEFDIISVTDTKIDTVRMKVLR